MLRTRRRALRPWHPQAAHAAAETGPWQPQASIISSSANHRPYCQMCSLPSLGLAPCFQHGRVHPREFLGPHRLRAAAWPHGAVQRRRERAANCTLLLIQIQCTSTASAASAAIAAAAAAATAATATATSVSAVAAKGKGARAHATHAEADGGGGEGGARLGVVAVVAEGEAAERRRQRGEERHEVDVRRSVVRRDAAVQRLNGQTQRDRQLGRPLTGRPRPLDDI